MNTRSYTFLDFPIPESFWLDWDIVVRLKEHVRQNFRSIVPEIPAACELDLMASGTSHNPGLLPLLGLYTPADWIERLPDSSATFDALCEWSKTKSEDELRTIALATDAPTWKELQRLRVYPRR